MARLFTTPGNPMSQLIRRIPTASLSLSWVNRHHAWRVILYSGRSCLFVVVVVENRYKIKRPFLKTSPKFSVLSLIYSCLWTKSYFENFRRFTQPRYWSSQHMETHTACWMYPIVVQRTGRQLKNWPRLINFRHSSWIPLFRPLLLDFKITFAWLSKFFCFVLSRASFKWNTKIKGGGGVESLICKRGCCLSRRFFCMDITFAAKTDLRLQENGIGCRYDKMLHFLVLYKLQIQRACFRKDSRVNLGQRGNPCHHLMFHTEWVQASIVTRSVCFVSSLVVKTRLKV